MIYTFSRVNPPGRDMKKISRPLYHVHFTAIHTNSQHKAFFRTQEQKRLLLRNTSLNDIYIINQIFDLIAEIGWRQFI